MQELFEQLARDLDLIGRAVLSESTLTRLIGGDAAGSNLARYVHRQFKVADQAEWRDETFYFKKFNWKMFSLDPQNLMLIKGSNGWVFLKPVAENFHHSWNSKYDLPDEEEASIQDRTTTFEYYWAYGNDELDDQGIDLARKDLEAGRHLRYGTTPNKNKYTAFPHVEKTQGFVKSRAREPKQLLADITAKLHSIEQVWVADRREDTSSQRKARDEYRKGIFADYMAKNYPDLSPHNPEYTRIRRQVEPSLYQGKMGQKVPPGASIEIAKQRQRAVDPEYRAGEETQGAVGYDNLSKATRPLRPIIARRALIELKRRNRGADLTDDPRMRLIRSLLSDEAYYWGGLMGQKMPNGLAGKLIKSKNKQTQEYVKLLINGNNPEAKQWFVHQAVEYIIQS